VDTHFWAPLFMTQSVLPAILRARQGGHIVNIASNGGVVGVPHLAPYCASKFAQIRLTQAGWLPKVAADRRPHLDNIWITRFFKGCARALNMPGLPYRTPIR
jgi:hypothetical protein